MFEPDVLAQIRSARRKFVAMAACYCMGVFNDSFFRQSAIWLALGGTGASLADQDRMSGYVMTVFALPYLFFAAPAGWLADRFSKHHVIIGAKGLEMAAMLVGAVGIITLNWYLILTMVLIMGWQSCIFSPSLNGTIPELYPQSYIPRANAILRTIVTISILGGVAASGLAVDYKQQPPEPSATVTQSDTETGAQDIAQNRPVDTASITPGGSENKPNEISPQARKLVGIVVIAVAALGFLTSFGVPRRDAADPQAPFPWKGPWHTLCELWQIRKDYLLWLVVLSTAYLWFVGSVVLLLLARLTNRQMDRSTTVGSLVLAAELIGIALGGIAASFLAKGRRWYWFLPVASLVMGGVMALMYVVPAVQPSMRLAVVFALTGAVGVAGGFFMIPADSFLQYRPAPKDKGKVLAAANFAIFLGVVVSGPVSNLLTDLVEPSEALSIMGLLTVGLALLLFKLLWHVKEDPDERPLERPVENT